MSDFDIAITWTETYTVKRSVHPAHGGAYGVFEPDGMCLMTLTDEQAADHRAVARAITECVDGPGEQRDYTDARGTIREL